MLSHEEIEALHIDTLDVLSTIQRVGCLYSWSIKQGRELFEKLRCITLDICAMSDMKLDDTQTILLSCQRLPHARLLELHNMLSTISNMLYAFDFVLNRQTILMGLKENCDRVLKQIGQSNIAYEDDGAGEIVESIERIKMFLSRIIESSALELAQLVVNPWGEVSGTGIDPSIQFGETEMRTMSFAIHVLSQSSFM